MVCDDELPCSIDACADGVCVFTPIDCDDGDACTVGDACLGGDCVSTPLDCTDEDPCTVHEGCDEGDCTSAPLGCSDGDSCTDDTCDGTDACVHTPIPDCDSGMPTTLGVEDVNTGVFAAMAPLQAIEIIQGPQGGIHVEVDVQFEAAGLPNTTQASFAAEVKLNDVLIGSLSLNNAWVLGSGGVYTRFLPISLFGDSASEYLGAPPEPTVATVCVTVTADGQEGDDCVEITLVDEE